MTAIRPMYAACTTICHAIGTATTVCRHVRVFPQGVARRDSCSYRHQKEPSCLAVRRANEGLVEVRIDPCLDGAFVDRLAGVGSDDCRESRSPTSWSVESAALAGPSGLDISSALLLLLCSCLVRLDETSDPVLLAL